MLQVQSDFRLILTSPIVGWFSISFVSPMEIENQPRLNQDTRRVKFDQCHILKKYIDLARAKSEAHVNKFIIYIQQ